MKTHRSCRPLCLILILVALPLLPAPAGNVPEGVKIACEGRVGFYTATWEGSRLEDGRPRVSDDILARMK
ncbi:MAG: hypothetical protein ACYTAS_10540, partial [Planctomycetota bacterium]